LNFEKIISMLETKKIKGIILDVDGVLWFGESPNIKAIDFINTLKKNNIPFCLLTNSCNISKSSRYKILSNAGFKISSSQLVTASELTAHWLKENNMQTIMYVGTFDTLHDFSEFNIVNSSNKVDAVVIGDPFDNLDRYLIHKVARVIINGATLIAMQKNAYWIDGTNWYVDNGFWIAGFEYATNSKAITIGKPNKFAYNYTIKKLGFLIKDSSGILFISDDIHSDLKGAKENGLITAYFGKNKDKYPWIDYYFKNYSEIYSLLTIRYND